MTQRSEQNTADQAICWIDGKILPASEARIPVLDHGFLFGDGVFEGIRVTPRGIFRFADHMKRLETAARAIGLVVPGGFERGPRGRARDDPRLGPARGLSPPGRDAGGSGRSESIRRPVRSRRSSASRPARRRSRPRRPPGASI
jgi:hypothetical protein